MQRKLLAALCVLLAARTGWSMTEEERKAYLEKFQQTVPVVATFNQWLQRSGELPPDFDALPKQNALPDPLKFLDGRPVKNAEDWKARREEIIKLFQKYDIGSMPPKPRIDSITPVDPAAATAAAAAGPGTARGGFGGGAFGRGGGGAVAGAVTKIVDLKYGPDSQITTRVTLTIPPGDGPFPVYINGGANVTARGYISCSFPGSTDAPPDIAKYYPDYDWGSMAKMAWTTSMVVDYLYTVPQVDKKCIAITGYSRDGKKALIAAALDERITAATPGSTGVGGVLPWRLGGERNFSESIESTTRSFPIWFTQRLRFFSGREDRLPVDGNLLVALMAPRACLAEWGDNDEVGQSFAMEQSVKSAMSVYKLLGKPEALGMMHVPGYHGANDQNRINEWLDIQFGKSQAKWADDWVFPWDYDQWHAQVKSPAAATAPPARPQLTTVAAWESQATDIRSRVEAMLGVNTPGSLAKPFAIPKLGDPSQPAAPARGGLGGPGAPAGAAAGGATRTLSEDIRAKASGNSYGWLQPQAGATHSRKVSFTGSAGNTIVADLYVANSAPANTKLPVVIWEHGYSYSLGYSWVYKNDLHPILALAQAGYAVLAYDQSGFGSRISEAAGFYNKFPQWSQMGHMIGDTRAAIDALGKDDQVDAQRLYLYGFSMGGNLALYTAALDPRVKGVVAACAFTPMHTDTPVKGTGGIARYYREHDLLPNLGAYEGHEANIPYDYDDLIAAIAPRPVYIIAPTYDRDATPADVRAAVEQAGKAYALYGASDNLKLDEPWDYSRLPIATQNRAIEWMKQKMK
jgi:cephalosporin-C deacetylase-like acetyl esterase